MVDPVGRQLGHPARQLERARLPGLKRRREVQLLQLRGDRVGDLVAAVPGGAAEQPGRAVQQLLVVMVPVVDALAAHEQPRRVLEVAVRRERHPELLQGIGCVFHRRALVCALCG